MANCSFCELVAGPNGFCVFHEREYGRCIHCNGLMRLNLGIPANQVARDLKICCKCIANSNGRCDKCRLLIHKENQVHILRLPRMGAVAQRVCDACFLNSQPLALFAPDERRRGAVIPLDAALQMRVQKREPRKLLDLVVREFEGLTPTGLKLAKAVAGKLSPSEPQLFMHFIPNAYKASVCKAMRIPSNCAIITAPQHIWRGLLCSAALRHFLDGSNGNILNVKLEDDPNLIEGIPTYIMGMWKEETLQPPIVEVRYDDPVSKRFWLFPEDLSEILKSLDTFPPTYFSVSGTGETSKTEYVDFAKISALIGGA